MRRGARPAGRGPVSRPAGPRRRGTRPPDVPNPGGSSSFAGTAAAGSLGPVAASEMGPVIGLPNPGGVPRPAVSHMQPVGPGGSPDGRLGEGRETRHTRATTDGPRDGAVTRNGSGPGRSRAGDGALGGSFRPALDRAAVATAESRGNRRAYPRCPSERSSRSARIRSRPDSPPPRSGRRGVPRARGPRAAHAGQPGRVGGCPTGAWPAPTVTRPRGPVTGSCPAAP